MICLGGFVSRPAWGSFGVRNGKCSNCCPGAGQGRGSSLKSLPAPLSLWLWGLHCAALGDRNCFPNGNWDPGRRCPSPRGCEELARGSVPRQGWGVWRTPSSGICGEPCDAPGIKAGMSFLLFPAPQPLLIPPIVSNSALFSWSHSPFFLSLLTPDFTE